MNRFREEHYKQSQRAIQYYDSCIRCERCGHSVHIPEYGNKAFCEWCGRYIFANAKDEFEYRLKEKIKKKWNVI